VRLAPSVRNWSARSMARAVGAPSVVMVGEPNFLSRTTLRPLGPIVTRTASPRRSMPFLSERRAVSSKMSCLANLHVPPGWCIRRRTPGLDRRSAPGLVGDDRQDVLLADDEELLVVDL